MKANLDVLKIQLNYIPPGHIRCTGDVKKTPKISSQRFMYNQFTSSDQGFLR